MARIHGLVTPLVTPLTADGDVDHESLRNVIDFQIDSGADGVFVLGSSGEAAYLDDADRQAVVRTATAHVAGRAPILVGALAPTPRRVVEQIRWIEPFRVDAVVVTAPYYADVTEQEVVRHFESIARATGLPVLAYDIPANTGRKLSRETCRELLRTKTVAGLKDSSGAIDDFRALLDGTERAGAALLTGADTQANLALSLGADGLVPGLANVRPDLFVSLIGAHRTGDRVRAAAAQARITTLTSILRLADGYGPGRHAAGVGAMKQALSRAGVIAGARLSDPLLPYPAELLEELDAVLERV